MEDCNRNCHTEGSKLITLRLLLIDDDYDSDLATEIEDLDVDNFDVTAIAPPADLTLDRDVDEDVDVFLVDYELDTVQPDGSVAPYRGLTFTAHLREQFPSFPIVILTRSDLRSWIDVQRTALAGAPFDAIAYKNRHLRNQREQLRCLIMSLVNGYERLRRSEGRSIDDLVRLLATDDEGRQRAIRALPPEDAWTEFEAAHWIRSVLLGYPGIVYDESHTATVLGLSIESFGIERVRELVRMARYTGPFHEEALHWWRHSLFDCVYRVCSEEGIDPTSADAFRSAANRRLGLSLDGSADIETKIEPADTVCYVLGVPVRVETSLPYFPDSRPLVMDKARVSYKAIRETNEVEEAYLDSDGRERLTTIRSSD